MLGAVLGQLADSARDELVIMLLKFLEGNTSKVSRICQYPTGQCHIHVTVSIEELIAYKAAVV